jgi:hypothetical protein
MALANAMTSDSASRVTRSSRDLRRLLLLALACVAGMTVLRAQDAPPASQAPPAQEAPASDETAGKPGEGESGAASEEIDFPDAPDPGAPGTTPAAKRPTTAPSTDAPEDASADAPEEKSAEEEEEPPPDAAPRTPGVVGPTPGRFEPTEKVRADFDVSFPVDI